MFRVHMLPAFNGDCLWVEFGKADEGYHFDVPMPGETFVAPAAKIRRFLRESGLQDLAPEPLRGARGAVAAPAAPRF